MLKVFVVLSAFFILFSAGEASATTWQCRWCGRKQSAPQQPAAMSNCPKNPFGKHHDWVKIHGRTE